MVKFVPYVDQPGTLSIGGVLDWLRITLSRPWLRLGEYSGAYHRLVRLYRHPDPWQLGCKQEASWLALTNAAIGWLAPRRPSMLEIRSGDRHQTTYLRQITDTVVGIDLEEDVIRRARRRLPDAAFHCGRGQDAAWIVGERSFVVATACQILSYSSHAKPILKNLQAVADCVLITNPAKCGDRLAPLSHGPGWRRFLDTTAETARWHCWSWGRATLRNQAHENWVDRLSVTRSIPTRESHTIHAPHRASSLFLRLSSHVAASGTSTVKGTRTPKVVGRARPEESGQCVRSNRMPPLPHISICSICKFSCSG